MRRKAACNKHLCDSLFEVALFDRKHRLDVPLWVRNWKTIASAIAVDTERPSRVK